MAAKRDQNSISLRLSQEEDLWMRKKAFDLDMDVAEWLRKCIALGSPILDGNQFCRRVELDDAMRQGQKQ